MWRITKQIRNAFLWLTVIGLSFFFSAHADDLGKIANAAKTSSYKTKRELVEEIIEKLKAGEIHPDLKEELRMIPTDNPSNKRLQSLMESLFKRLYPSHDLSKEPVKFLLIDNARPNAFRLKFSQKPVYIGVTTGLLKKIQNLDQLAAILSHEMSHYYIASRIGEGGNSKGEESWSDVRSIWDLADAGFDPVQVRELHRVVLKDEDKSTVDLFDSIRKVFDVHPGGDNRVASIELGLTALHRERGSIRRPVTKLDSAFSEVATSTEGSHDSFVKNYLASHKFNFIKDQAEKFRVVSQLIESMPHWNSARVSDVEDVLENLTTNAEKKSLAQSKNPWKTTKTWNAFQQMMNVVLDLSKKQTFDSIWDENELISISNKFYFTSAGLNIREFDKAIPQNTNIEMSGKAPALGAIHELQKLVGELFAATDLKTAQKLSAQILSELEKQSIHKSDLLQRIAWPQFTMPDLKVGLKPTDLPWNSLVTFALQDSSKSISRVLYIFGVLDHRLFEGQSDQSFEFATQKINQIAARPSLDHGFGTRISDLRVAGSQVIVITPDPYGRDNSQSTNDPRPKLEELLIKAKDGDRQALQTLEAFASNKNLDRLKYNLRIQHIFGDKFFDWNPELMTRINSILVSTSSNIDSPKELAKIFNELLSKDLTQYTPFIRKFFLEGYGRLDYWVPGNDSRVYPTDYIASKLFQFAVHDPFKLFSDAEKLDFLDKRLMAERFRNALLEANQVADGHDRWAHYDQAGTLKEFRRLLEYQRPTTWSEVYDLLNKFKNSPFKFAKILAMHEAESFFELNGNGIDLHALLSPLDPAITKDSEMKEFQKAFKKAIDSYDFSKDELKKSVETWTIVANLDLIPREEKRRTEIIQSLFDRIQGVNSSAEKAKLLEDILLSSGVEHPVLREKIVGLWAESMCDSLGLDNGTDAYFKTIESVIKRIGSEAKYGTRYEMLSKLADKIQTQDALSEEMRRYVSDISKDQLAMSQIPSIVAEFVIKQLGDDLHLARALAKFLTEPSTASSQDALMQKLESNSAYRFWKHEFDDGQIKRSDFLNSFDTFHQNYWSQPLTIRTAISDFILRPPNKRSDHPKEKFDESFRFIVQEILPHDPKYGATTIAFLEDYLAGLEDYQKGPYLAAVMAATRRESINDLQPSAGQFLGTVLDQLGPAEGKIEQAVHSYPDTPEDLKAGMENSKIMRDRPLRWDIWRQYKTLPKEIQAQIERVNDVEGAASFWVVLNVTLKEGSELAKANGSTEAALAMLRPYAAEQMSDGFSRAKAFVHRRQTKENTAVTKNLLEIVDEAEKLARIEVDPNLTEHQFKKMKAAYGGIKVEMDGQTYGFDAINLLTHGPNFRLMSLAKGIHFNSLPKVTSSEVEVKRGWAKAYIFVEFALLAAGIETDEDPHGGNARVDISRRLFTRLDPGGFAVNPPSAEDLNLLGQILFEAATEGANNPSKLRSLLAAKLRQAQEAHPMQKSFLIRLQKSILALQDYWKFLKPNDFLDILGSLHSGGHIHQNIMEGFFSSPEFSFGKLQKLQGLVPKPSSTSPDCTKALRIVGSEGSKLRSSQSE